MSVNYSLAYMRSIPSDENSPKLYYAKAQATGEVTIDELAEDIAYATSLTDGDGLNVIRAMVRQMNKNLAAGRIVRWESFGSFQLQLRSTGAPTAKEFTSANITSASIQFRPGNSIKAATRSNGGLTFHRVAGLKATSLPTDEETGGNNGDGNAGGDDGSTENPMG